MWFIQQAERWKSEQEALQLLGISFQVDEELKAQGFLRLDLEITEHSAIANIPAEFLPIKLSASFPYSYPYFRPMVYAPDLDLPRHQNRMDKNLCLLPRSPSYWLPQTTLAAFLEEQLPKVLVQGMITDPEQLQELADEQAEPVSEYYQVQLNSPVIIDTAGFDSIQTEDHNIHYLGQIKFGFELERKIPNRILALECRNAEKNMLHSMPTCLENTFKSSQHGPVYRISQPPPFGDPEKDYQWLTELLAADGQRIKKFDSSIRLKDGSTITNVVALTFPEEHEPGIISHGWLFLVLGASANAKVRTISSFKYYARPSRLNNSELSFRIPKLRPLAQKSIAVFGLGALGAPSVIEFAKNGIKEIRLIDFDIVDAGTTVRWPLGLSAAGLLKTDALERFLQDNYPFVQVRKFRYTIGGAVPAVGILTKEQLSLIGSLDEMIDGVSMIYDATAEAGISHFLSQEAKNREIPYLCVYGTQGVWGGAVMRTGLGITEGCWMCFQYGLFDGTYPSPPVDSNGSIQTAGCGDISFTGASFELSNIVSSGVRLAISTLCSDEEGYENMNADIGILALVDDNQNPILPHWSSHQLAIHPQCPYCNNKQS
jgi:hypothetical protein